MTPGSTRRNEIQPVLRPTLRSSDAAAVLLSAASADGAGKRYNGRGLSPVMGWPGSVRLLPGRTGRYCAGVADGLVGSPPMIFVTAGATP